MEKIINFIDKFYATIPPGYSGLISLAIIIIVIFAIWRFIKGNFIWIVLVIIFVPAVWPSLKNLSKIIVNLFLFLLVKIKI